MAAKMHHVGLWVRDLEATASFYQRWFGARPGPLYRNPEKGFSSRFLTLAEGCRLEVMTLTGMTEAGERGHARPGWAHLALSLDSEEAVDALAARLREAGAPVLDGPRRTGDGCYECVVADPEGNRVEITV